MDSFEPVAVDLREKFIDTERVLLDQFVGVDLDVDTLYELSDNVYLEKESQIAYNIYVME